MTTTAIVKPAHADDIDKAIARMSVAFQRQIDAGTIKVYREALSDLPIWAIEAAELQLRRKGGDFFPTAPRWHHVAEELLAGRQRELVSQAATEGHECTECRDTGWADVEKDGKRYVVPCSCRPRNTNYQRMTASSRKGLNEEVK